MTLPAPDFRASPFGWLPGRGGPRWRLLCRRGHGGLVRPAGLSIACGACPAAQRSGERPVFGYRAVMFCAWRPVGICPTSKDTFWFSSRERFPWPTVVRSRTVLE
jgi:hypothetical protein